MLVSLKKKMISLGWGRRWVHAGLILGWQSTSFHKFTLGWDSSTYIWKS